MSRVQFESASGLHARVVQRKDRTLIQSEWGFNYLREYQGRVVLVEAHQREALKDRVRFSARPPRLRNSVGRVRARHARSRRFKSYRNHYALVAQRESDALIQHRPKVRLLLDALMRL